MSDAPRATVDRSRLAVLLVPFLALALVLGTSGCATLFASGPDQVPVATNPAGAYIYVNGVYVGQSPTVVDLHRDQPGNIQIYLPGYRPIVMVRHKGLNGWFIANILWVALLVPVIVDLVTGDYQRYDDDAIAIGLTPDGGPPPQWYQQPAAPPPPPQYPAAPTPPQPYPPPAPPQ